MKYGVQAFSSYRSGREEPKLPTQWRVVQVGRETPVRVYELAEKPQRRHSADPFRDKAELFPNRFDTKEEAESFIAQARVELEGSYQPFLAAERARMDAQETERKARITLHDATKAWAALRV